jgi:hypothetical protein
MNPLKFFKAMLTSVPRLTPADCAARVRAGEAFIIDVRDVNTLLLSCAPRAHGAWIVYGY